MPISEVFTVLDRLASAGCRFWLEGGWGVDALVGRQTRPHRDVDVDIDADDEGLALSVLAELGYRVETDWRPNRVELIAPGRGWVDVHPLIVDAEGNARQAALDGGFHQFPKSYFVEGTLYGVPIPCFFQRPSARSDRDTNCETSTSKTSLCSTSCLPEARVHGLATSVRVGLDKPLSAAPPSLSRRWRRSLDSATGCGR
jgi:lincosamide nucleotidyltransferase A/C/D/E